MNAITKKKIERFPNLGLIGMQVEAIDRETSASFTAKIVEATNSYIMAEFSNGKYGDILRKFRRDTATQMGGSLKLNLEAVLA